MSNEDFTLTMSPTIGALAAALAKAQLEMRPALKDATNPHYKNKYASLAACLEAVRPLHTNGIAVVQPPANHGGVNGVSVATILIHSSGEWLRGDLFMPASKQDAQGYGSALSYARRYCLQATVGLATDDDDAEAAVKGPQGVAVPTARAPGPVSQALEGAELNEVVTLYIGEVERAADSKALLSVYSRMNSDLRLPEATRTLIKAACTERRKTVEGKAA